MGKSRTTDLPLLTESFDLANDFIVIHNDNEPLTERTARAPISRFSDVLSLPALTSGKVTASGTYNLSLDSDDVIAIDTAGANLDLFLPTPSLEKTKSFIVFTDSPLQDINVYDDDNVYQFTMSLSTDILFFEAYSIEDDWYVIRGFTQIGGQVILSASFPGTESNSIPSEVVVITSSSFDALQRNRLPGAITRTYHEYDSISYPGTGNHTSQPISETYHEYDSVLYPGTGNHIPQLISETYHIYVSRSYPGSQANSLPNSI